MGFSLWIGLGVVVASAAFIVPAFFALHPEPATSPDQPAPEPRSRPVAAENVLRTPDRDVVISPARRVASGLWLLGIVVAMATALAGAVGALVLVISVLFN